MYDPVGGQYAEPALRSLGPDGRYLVVGFASGDIPRFPINLVLLKRCSIIGVNWGGHIATNPSVAKEVLTSLLGWITEHKISPASGEVFKLADTGKAMMKMLDRKAIGKIVIHPNDWGNHNMSDIQPYTIETSAADLADLKQRLELTRWPDKETTDDWSQGIPLDYMKEIHRYWLTEYDWPSRLARINKWPGYKVDIDGLGIHFLHVKSENPNAMKSEEHTSELQSRRKLVCRHLLETK